MAGTAGGVLSSPPGLPRVDLFGTYKACDSVFLVFLPAAFGEAVLAFSTARLPGTPPFPWGPCALGFPRPVEVSARQPEVACSKYKKKQSGRWGKGTTERNGTIG